MILYDFLKMLDPMTHVVIWVNGSGWDTEIPQFAGWASDVPFWLLECTFYSDKTEDIFPFHTSSDNGRDMLIINVKEEE